MQSKWFCDVFGWYLCEQSIVMTQLKLLTRGLNEFEWREFGPTSEQNSRDFSELCVTTKTSTLTQQKVDETLCSLNKISPHLRALYKHKERIFEPIITPTECGHLLTPSFPELTLLLAER